MFEAKDYTYRVFWSEEDQAYVATVIEFPRLSSIEDTANAALDGMRNEVEFLLGVMEKDNMDIPTPLHRREYSGKVVLRMSKEQHARVVEEAAEQGVSINQLLVSRI